MTLNPFLLERQFATLKHSLHYRSSFRTHLLRIAEFLEPILESHDATFISAYGKELVPLSISLILNKDFTGTPPSFLSRLEVAFKELKYSIPGALSQDEWERVINTLQAERQKIESILTRRARAQEAGEPFARLVAPAPGVSIPLVEHELLASPTLARFASLKRLTVECSFAAHEEYDHLQIESFVGSQGGGPSRLKVSIESARTLVRRMTGYHAKKPLMVRCAFGESDMVEGESLGAGLAAEIAVQFLRLLEHPEEFRVGKGVAITGLIDARGNLHVVDAEGLKSKVEACTFSALDVLIVPREQEQLAREHAFRISSEALHGDSPLSIVGIDNIGQLFDDRRLTWSRRVPLTRRAIRRSWKNRRPVAIGIIVLLVAVIARLQYGPLDKNPAEGIFEGELLIVKNAGGETIDQIHVGSKTVGFSHTQQSISAWNLSAFADLDGDGRREEIWAQTNEAEGGDGMSVLCKRVTEKGLLWSVQVGKKLSAPAQPSVNENSFHVVQITAEDFTGKGTPSVIVLARSTFYPTLVIQLDGRTGALIGEYLNAGHLLAMGVLPPDSQRVRKIVLCGMNNAMRSACALVLDPRLIQGHSPWTDGYKVEGYSKGMEELYILLPRTIVGDAFKFRVKENAATSLNIHGDSSQLSIELGIRDVILPDPTPFESREAMLYVIFDWQMRPVQVGTGDEYDLMAEKLLAMHKISKLPDEEYLASYMKTLKYWDGKSWREEWTRNADYVEELSKLSQISTAKEELLRSN